MADPTNRDDSVERAAQEIRRRMLRAEKLKRIEEAGMARLKASGWQPAQRPTVGRGGPTLQDAAQAIESIEEQKEALAREAKRRLMQRASESMADQGHVRRHAADKAALKDYLDRVQAQLKQVHRNADSEGLVASRDMLRRYLDGVGGTVYFQPQDLRKHKAVQDSEKRVQNYFVDWMIDPAERPKNYGRAAGIAPPMVKARVNRISPELLALKDGQSIQKSDYWTSNLQHPSKFYQGPALVLGFDRPSVDLEGFAGRSQIRGDGDFLFSRKGDQIEFTGVVDHKFDEPYNFEEGKPLPTLEADPLDVLTGRVFNTFKGEDARQLALHGRAKEFRMKSQWPQQAKGSLRINPDGTLSLESIEWTDIPRAQRYPWP